MFEKEKEVKVVGLPEIPADSTEEYYTLTITNVTKVKKAEVSEFWVDIEDGTIITASYNKEDGHKYKKFSYPTGDIETSTHSTDIYEQKLDDLDVGDLATYINRTR